MCPAEWLTGPASLAPIVQSCKDHHGHQLKIFLSFTAYEKKTGALKTEINAIPRLMTSQTSEFTQILGNAMVKSAQSFCQDGGCIQRRTDIS